MKRTRSPVEIVASAFGGQSKLARRLDILPSTVSNWKRTGIPKAARWDISQALRSMRDGGEITPDQFLEAVEALEGDLEDTEEETEALALA